MMPFASLIAALVAAAATACGTWLVRGSTAVPAGLWAVAAWLALACEMAVRAGGGLVDPAVAANVRLVVAALSLCPAMSLLGAKRPQHGVWQFIVATLAVVIALPAASAALARPGSLPDVHLLAKGFILVLVVVGWMNFVGTRRGLAATLIAAGQMVLVRPFLPGVGMAAQADSLTQAPLIDCVGSWAAAVGTLLAVAQAAGASGSVRGRRLRRSAAPAPHPLAAAIDPPFLALRETLGAAWTLRIIERFAGLAEARGWPCRLQFSGLVVEETSLEGGWQRDAKRAFQALLRRFVTADWLRRHRGSHEA